MANRTITVNVEEKMYTLARYNVEVDDPRPGQYMFPILIILPISEKAKVSNQIVIAESYREDYRDAQKFETIPEQEEFYQNMKSGAESGWDYSTRW